VEGKKNKILDAGNTPRTLKYVNVLKVFTCIKITYSGGITIFTFKLWYINIVTKQLGIDIKDI
jgi:hypothetical protein